MRKPSYFIAVELLAGSAMVFTPETVVNLPPGVEAAMFDTGIEVGLKSRKEVSSHEGATLTQSLPTRRLPRKP